MQLELNISIVYKWNGIIFGYAVLCNV